MRDFLKRHRDGLILSFFILSSLLIISHQTKDYSAMTYLKRGGIAVIAPFQTVVDNSFRFVSGLWNDYIFLLGVRSENKELRNEVHRLKGEAQFLREQLFRAGRLDDFLRYQAETGLMGITARVIGESPDPWTRVIILDKGAGDSIRKGLPVVTPDGLVGRVIEVSKGNSVVRLLVDRASRVPVLISRSRSRAILEGENSGTCRLKFVDRTEDIVEGDVVITSGLANIFPRGIEVGKVSVILKKSYGLYQYAQVVPSVPMSRLEDVIVLTGEGGEDRH
ncbi:MAG: rod shape-determining protein MreC [bacterium]